MANPSHISVSHASGLPFYRRENRGPESSVRTPGILVVPGLEPKRFDLKPRHCAVLDFQIFILKGDS